MRAIAGVPSLRELGYKASLCSHDLQRLLRENDDWPEMESLFQFPGALWLDNHTVADHPHFVGKALAAGFGSDPDPPWAWVSFTLQHCCWQEITRWPGVSSHPKSRRETTPWLGSQLFSGQLEFIGRKWPKNEPWKLMGKGVNMCHCKHSPSLGDKIKHEFCAILLLKMRTHPFPSRKSHENSRRYTFSVYIQNVPKAAAGIHIVCNRIFRW